MLRLGALLACALALAGCGAEDAERIRDDVEQRAGDVRERAREARERARGFTDGVRVRIRETLERIEQAVPEAGPQTRPPSRAQAGTIAAFLTETLVSVDSYWTRTLAENRLPEPRVGYRWVARGRRAFSGCGELAGDRSAFYCPRDDTIYIGERLAAEIAGGVARGFPGERAGGRAIGDFGVAYVVAHEYAHNVQQELGFFEAAPSQTAEPFELQADCMAGLWGNSVYREGRLKPGDVEEAMQTALAVGDFDVGNAQHHGTPTERRDAWLTGFRGGDPADCTRFLDV